METTTAPAVTLCEFCNGTGTDPDFSTPTCRVECGSCNGTGGRPAAAEDLTALVAWLAEQTWSDFAVSLARQARRGSLSERQIAAAKSMHAKSVARDAERAARPAPATATASCLDLTTLPSGRYAVPNGDTRLKLQVDVITKGKWTGWVFVKDAAEYGQGRKYGSQRPGQTYRGDVQDALAAILADPRAAAAAYGHLVGRCGVCGRHLEDAESIARGIGPICWEKF